MAVHVSLSSDELSAALSPFGLGPVRQSVGLPEGSVNTNHRIAVDRGSFLARLTQVRSEAELRFEATLLSELRAEGLPVVPPLRLPAEPDRSFVPFRGGFLSLFPWVAGETLDEPLPDAKRRLELGRLLGRFHRLSRGSSLSRENPYGVAVVERWLCELEREGGRGEPEVARALPLLRRGFEVGRAIAHDPVGLVHADVFRDNVLWLGERVAALLDFEMAGAAPFELDLAVAMLDWAFDPKAPRGERFAAARQLVEGYENARAPEPPPEAETLHRCLAFAATRFTLSRLRDFHFSTLPEGALRRKSWREMADRLEEALRLEPRALAALSGL
ncbi:MAG: homoserine kinase [Deltaproteobacteria bacterium]